MWPPVQSGVASESRADAPRQLATLLAIAVVVALAPHARGQANHNWQMAITVDNEYTAYFGDRFMSTQTIVGGDSNWVSTDSYTVAGVDSRDYLYVATASDRSTVQGFLGTFSNLTTGETFHTSAAAGTPWEVFPAGQYLTQLNALDPTIPATVWPRGPGLVSFQPSHAQVQTAVNFAETNGLWVTPSTAPGFRNSDSPNPWRTRPGIPGGAEWIWHDTGRDLFGTRPAPFPNFNHDEFLVFRVPGTIPEPSTAASVFFSIAAAAVRRRAS